MIRSIFILFLLCSLRCFGAAGDVSWATVETNGWVLQLVVLGVNTNGTFASNYDTNYFGTGKIQVSAIRQGYDDAGLAITSSVTVMSGKQLRFPYPQTNVWDVMGWNDTLGIPSVIGPDARIRVSLTDYIYSGDSNITCRIESGFYTATTPNSANSNVTITNSSVLAHEKVLGNWSKPCFERFTNSISLSGIFFHRSGREGRPVRAVRFIAYDTGGHSNSVFVTRMVSNRDTNTLLVISEYVGTLDTSAFSQGPVRCEFTAWPWEGDTNSVLSTTLGTFTMPTPLYAAVTNYCDRLQTYGESYAVVDPTNGISGGVVTASFTPGMSLTPFQTVDQALVAGKTFNGTTFGRLDTGGLTIYLTNGTYNYTDGVGTRGTNTFTWTEIARYPGLLRTNVLLAAAVNNRGVTMTKISGVTIVASTTSFFNGEVFTWLNGCYVSMSGVAPFNNCPIVYLTGNHINQIANGMSPFGSANCNFAIVRGNVLEYANPALFYMMVGNMRLMTNLVGGTYFTDSKVSFGGVEPHGSVLAYNAFYGMDGNSSQLNVSGSNGVAIVQNVFEWIAVGSQAMWQIDADGSTITPIKNVLMVNNTLTGQRANLAYNSIGSAPALRTQWTKLNNLIEDDNIKSDDFPAESAPDGARIGNWSQLWSVGHFGNWLGNAGVGPASFPHWGVLQQSGYPGLQSFETLDGFSVSTNYMQFVNPKSYDGVNRGTGNGDYRLKSLSPLVTWGCRWYLPFDIEGNARGNFDPPGAYSSASPRKGGGFF